MSIAFERKEFLAAVLALYQYVKDLGEFTPSEIKLKVSGEIYEFMDVTWKESELFFKFDGVSFKVNLSGDEFNINVISDNVKSNVKPKTSASGKGKRIIRSKVAGYVLELYVSEDDALKKGDALLVLEAMKLEIEVKAPIDGHVKKIFVKKGDVVKLGDPLLILET